MDTLFFATIVFTTLFVCALCVRHTEPPNYAVPLVTFPAEGILSNLTKQSTTVAFNASLDRSSLHCKNQITCYDKYHAFVAVLPKTAVPNSYLSKKDISKDPWDPVQNAWYLSTQLHFATGFPLLYPTASVLVVPEDTPSWMKFLIDYDDYNTNQSLNSPVPTYGLRPMIQNNNTLLNMEISTMFVKGASPKNLNVTGDYPHSFVLVNLAKHPVYFAGAAFDIHFVPGPRENFWKINSNAWVLMWPAHLYHASMLDGVKRAWKCALIPQEFQNFNSAAAIAERTMVYLRNESPLAP